MSDYEFKNYRKKGEQVPKPFTCRVTNGYYFHADGRVTDLRQFKMIDPQRIRVPKKK